MLPILKSDDQTFMLMQSRWSSEINPLLSKPIIKGLALKDVSLLVGDNNINHLLQDMQQGYLITNQNASANIYRSKPFDERILTLNSDAVVKIDLWVY